jgi:hypothetical protein
MIKSFRLRVYWWWSHIWIHNVSKVTIKIVAAIFIFSSTVAPVIATTSFHKPAPTQPPVTVKTAAVIKSPQPAKPTQSTPAAEPSPQAPATPAPAPPPAQPKPIPASSPAPGSGAKTLSPAPANQPDPSPPANNPSQPGDNTPPPATGGYTSTNWSGYVATSGGYTSVSGSWRVPAATGNGISTTADGTWIGIGGVFSNDLIQTGTGNTIDANGQVSTYAFYELLPDVALEIPSLSVSAGDSMSANITETSSGVWQITITDNTRGQTFSTSVNYVSSHSSAEWIEEDPSYASGAQVPFDNFGSAAFTASSATASGTSATIAGNNGRPITMLSSGQPVAVPSILTGSGTGFTVTRK